MQYQEEAVELIPFWHTQKREMICILVQTFLPPHFSSQRKSSGVSSKNVLKVLSDGSAWYPAELDTPLP